MNKLLFFSKLFIVFGLYSHSTIKAENITLTLEKVVQLVNENSPLVLAAKQQFNSSYWQYRTYVASYLPSVRLSSTIPSINRSISSYTNPDGSPSFIRQNNMSNSASLSLEQSVPFTGGALSVSSSLHRIETLNAAGTTSYNASPIGISFIQPLGKSNPFRWSRQTEPLRYRIAKIEFLAAIEDIKRSAIQNFFELATAQINLEIQRLNLSNADTLYKISLGRYHTGTIAEDELLQMELSLINASTSVVEAEIAVHTATNNLRTCLGLSDNVEFTLLLPNSIPVTSVDLDDVLMSARVNNIQWLQLELREIESKKAISEARLQRLNATLIATYNLGNTASTLDEVYANPEEQQTLNLTLSVPILDWGQSRGRTKMAKSSKILEDVNIELARTEFDQALRLEVVRFNMQAGQIRKAAKADTIAQMRFEVAKYRFVSGKTTVTDLNLSINERDAAKQGYLSSLSSYWQMYYSLRRKTLFDFEYQMPVEENLDRYFE